MMMVNVLFVSMTSWNEIIKKLFKLFSLSIYYILRIILAKSKCLSIAYSKIMDKCINVRNENNLVSSLSINPIWLCICLLIDYVDQYLCHSKTQLNFECYFNCFRNYALTEDFDAHQTWKSQNHERELSHSRDAFWLFPLQDFEDNDVDQGSSGESLKDGNGKRVRISSGYCSAWNPDTDCDTQGWYQREDRHVSDIELAGGSRGQ